MRLVNLIGSVVLLAAGCANLPQRARITTSFDLDWQFLKVDVPGAEQPAFDDRAWRTLNVPHDWSIEGPFDQNNPTGSGGGYLPSGIGWYHKRFTLPTDYARRRIFIEFDGVMANSEVWVNAFHLGKRPYGYVSFRYELTDHLNFGPDKPNILSVRADNSAQPASRWYTGAGIYRHVRLVVTDPVHIDHWGVFVTTPKVTCDHAIIHIQTTVINQSDTQREVTLQTAIFAPDGKTIQPSAKTTQTIPAGESIDFQQDITVEGPQLWDLDHPNLYSVSSKVLAAGAALDDDVTQFGIREFRFDAATGFWLNGRNIKIKGVCLHHDGGGLGAAVPLRAWERRLELLKRVGVNAIRTAHNPPAPEFLDLCDRMGFLVMDEMFDCWTVAKNPYDYHLYFNEWSKIDARDTVLRDRNHPCIILYSAGNEIHDTPNAELAKGILKGLLEVFHEADPTRPVTQGLFRPNVSRDYDNGLADMLDVVGQNYREGELVAAHQAKPQRKVIGTENGHDRRVWLALRDNEFMAGQFLWSGIDYLGEAKWPNISSAFGLIDRTGTFRPRTYERQSWWSDQPMVHIARIEPVLAGTDMRRRRGYDRVSNWTPYDPNNYTEGDVEVYSNCEQVELILNGKSLGLQPRPGDDAPRTWKIPFEPGTIKALGRNKNQVVAGYKLRTAGKPVKIILAADRAKLTSVWDDVSYVTVTVVDGNDVLCPWADDLITFNISGPGIIAAVDNGDIASHEPFQASRRRLFQGRCFAIIRTTAASGRIILTASTRGLKSASIAIEAVALPMELKK